MNAPKVWAPICVLVGLLAVTVYAVNIETVTVGNPGTAGELSGEGAGGGGPLAVGARGRLATGTDCPSKP